MSGGSSARGVGRVKEKKLLCLASSGGGEKGETRNPRKWRSISVLAKS